MTSVPTVCLPARQLFEVADASAVRIVCTAGCLWITLDHDTRDVILEPGDGFEAEQPRRALVYAFTPSSFTMDGTDQRRVRRRLWKKSSDWSRSPRLWAATRAASAS
jgi:hypothetical protein